MLGTEIYSTVSQQIYNYLVFSRYIVNITGRRDIAIKLETEIWSLSGITNTVNRQETEK